MSDRDYMRADWGGRPRNPFWVTNPGTKALIIGLIGIHLLILKVGSREAWQSVWNVLALHPEFVLQRFWVWQLVTGGLLHTDDEVWHLLWNCVMIFFFGRVVEQRLGPKRFLVFCLAATICSGLAYVGWAVMIDSLVPALGASGACMGMIAISALWYPRLTILLFGIFPMQLWVLAAVIVLIDVFGALGSGPGGVAHTAHLGGALYGFLYFRYADRASGVFGAIDRYVDGKKHKKQRKVRRREQERA